MAGAGQPRPATEQDRRPTGSPPARALPPQAPRGALLHGQCRGMSLSPQPPASDRSPNVLVCGTIGPLTAEQAGHLQAIPKGSLCHRLRFHQSADWEHPRAVSAPPLGFVARFQLIDKRTTASGDPSASGRPRAPPPRSNRGLTIESAGAGRRDPPCRRGD